MCKFSSKNLFLFWDFQELLEKDDLIQMNSLCDPSKVLFGFHVSSRSRPNLRARQRGPFVALFSQKAKAEIEDAEQVQEEQLEGLSISPKTKVYFQNSQEATGTAKKQGTHPQLPDPRQVGSGCRLQQCRVSVSVDIALGSDTGEAQVVEP